MAVIDPSQTVKKRSGTRLKAGDIAFLVLLVLALAGVILSGRFAYQQGTLLESAKGNALTLVRWAEAVADASAKAGPLPLSACATVADKSAALAEPPKPGARPVTWAACREALLGSGGPMFELVNPFDARNLVTGTRCERKSSSARGLVVLEKGTPSPPGFPSGVVWSVLVDEEPLVRGLMLRVQVCDGGGYPIRLAEVTL